MHLGCSPDATANRRTLEMERDVDAGGPAVGLSTPEVRSAQPDPLELPHLLQDIQHNTAVDLIDVLHAESALEPTR